MAGNKRKVRIIFTIINIIISIGLLTFSYFNYQKHTNNLQEKEKIKSDYQTLMNDQNIDEEAIKDINQKITDLENIDETTSNLKKDVYKLSSELEKKIRNKETNIKIAYLTFDDGPYYNTYKVLKILKENKVKATFFTTNVNGEKCYDNRSANCHEVYSAIAKYNHTIANHTHNHGWNRGVYKSADTLWEMVKKQEELIKEKTGLTTNIMRFPGGSGTPKAQGGQARFKTMTQKLSENGYGWVDWTAQDGDGGYLPNYDTGWKNLMNSINESIEVVLFHDYHAVTTSLLPNFIKYLRDHNYIILPLFYESVMINK